MANLSNRTTGIILIAFGLLVTFHWYLVHLVKFFAGDDSQLIPELGIAVTGLLVLGIGMTLGFIKVK
jgi:hypothetical protein